MRYLTTLFLSYLVACSSGTSQRGSHVELVVTDKPGDTGDLPSRKHCHLDWATGVCVENYSNTAFTVYEIDDLYTATTFTTFELEPEEIRFEVIENVWCMTGSTYNHDSVWIVGPVIISITNPGFADGQFACAAMTEDVLE